MRDDLLDAQASVNWPESQFKTFEERIDTWLGNNINVEIEETPPPATHNVIAAVEKEPFPRFLVVEWGAYLNAIRSSLDLLATALAHRHSVPNPDKAYFPVAKSATDFTRGNYKGSEFVKALPATERARIEALKPYQGGNEPLWMLHQFDIVRKHRRLMDVEINPARFSISGFGTLKEDFVRVMTQTGYVRTNQKTIIGLLRKGAPHYQMKLTPFVAISEVGPLEHAPIMYALHLFARLADSIIKVFDA